MQTSSTARRLVALSDGALVVTVPFTGLLNRLLAKTPYLLVGLSLSPSLVWIAQDEHVWPWDQAWYGQVSVELFYTLLFSPQRWPQAMVTAFGTKAPGIAWLGQWFVPLGAMTGSTDKTLLLSIAVTQLLTLYVSFATLRNLSKGGVLEPLIATLSIASIPLFVGLTHQYFVEPLQTLAVAWFLYIVSRAKQWHPTTLLGSLLGAFATAMAAKVTSPLYCVGPALLGLYYLVQQSRHGWQVDAAQALACTRRSIALLAIVAIAATLVGAWYMLNFQSVLDFAASAAAGDELYGTRDTFLNKARYWSAVLRVNFAYVPVAICAASAFLLALGHRIVRQTRVRRLDLSDLLALIATIQIAIVICSFSVTVNQENRYLMPLAPYFAVLVYWTVVHFHNRWVSGVSMALVFIQAISANSQALGFSAPQGDVSPWLTALDRNTSRAELIGEVASATCWSSTSGRYTIVGVEEPWFNANSMAYASAKEHEQLGFRCYYTSLGYEESDVERAWSRLLALNALHFVTLPPTADLVSPQLLNQVSAAITERVESGGLFEPIQVGNGSAVRAFRRRS